MTRILTMLAPLVWLAIGCVFFNLEFGLLWALCSFIGAATVFLVLRSRIPQHALSTALISGCITPVCVTASLLFFFVPSMPECEDDPCTITVTISAEAGSEAP